MGIGQEEDGPPPAGDPFICWAPPSGDGYIFSLHISHDLLPFSISISLVHACMRCAAPEVSPPPSCGGGPRRCSSGTILTRAV